MPDKLFEESMNRWNKQYQEFLEKQAKAHVPPYNRASIDTKSLKDEATPIASEAAPSDSEYISNESKPKRRNLTSWPPTPE